MTRRKIDRIAVERAYELHLAKRYAEPEPVSDPGGFDADTASAITGLDIDTLDSLAERGLVTGSIDHNVTVDGEECWDLNGRYSEHDLLRAMIVAQLDAAGVPPLVLFVLAHNLEIELGAGLAPLHLIAEAQQEGDAVPLTLELANEWIVDDRGVTRPADDPEGRAAIEAGEAVGCVHGPIADDLRRRIAAYRAERG